MANTGDLERKTRQLDGDVQAIWDKLDEVTATQQVHSARFDQADVQLRSIKTTVTRHDNRFTEVFQDLDAIKLQQMLHGDQLARQADKLAHHDVLLERQGATLDQHTAVLDQHTAVLHQLTSRVGQLLDLFGVTPSDGPPDQN